MILVSKNARISRPKTKVVGIETIIKNDQFKAHIGKHQDGDNNPVNIAKLIGSDTLKNFAIKLAEMHTPINIDYYAKFGVTRVAVTHLEPKKASLDNLPAQSINKPIQSDAKLVDTQDKKKECICNKCGAKVSYVVAKFCWNNVAKFGGNAFCMDCQKTL